MKNKCFKGYVSEHEQECKYLQLYFSNSGTTAYCKKHNKSIKKYSGYDEDEEGFCYTSSIEYKDYDDNYITRGARDNY